MALYPYTLQPIELGLTDAEFRQAQMQLFDSNNQALARINTKTWVIIGIITALAMVGLILVRGYSTIIFWLMLVGVVVFLLARTIGLKWYVKKEFEKQMASQQMPTEMNSLKLGIQQHGLIMSMPVTNMPKMPRGYNQAQMRGTPTQQAIIKWENVKNWQETPDFIVMMFDVNGQQGSQIVPKRLANQKFPLETLRHHLQEEVGIQGLSLNNPSTNNVLTA